MPNDAGSKQDQRPIVPQGFHHPGPPPGHPELWNELVFLDLAGLVLPELVEYLSKAGIRFSQAIRMILAIPGNRPQDHLRRVQIAKELLACRPDHASTVLQALVSYGIHPASIPMGGLPGEALSGLSWRLDKWLPHQGGGIAISPSHMPTLPSGLCSPSIKIMFYKKLNTLPYMIVGNLHFVKCSGSKKLDMVTVLQNIYEY